MGDWKWTVQGWGFKVMQLCGIIEIVDLHMHRWMCESVCLKGEWICLSTDMIHNC